jgi:hypothetical protein
MSKPNSFLFSAIDINSLPPSEMRYNTVADWVVTTDEKEEKTLHLYYPDLPFVHERPDLLFLLLTHEQIEAEICLHMGISQQDVDEFDMEFEKNRQFGDNGEPGDHLAAPYYVAHQLAEAVEKTLALKMKIDWNFYGKWVDLIFSQVCQARSTKK